MCGSFTRYLPWPEIVGLYRLTLDYETGKNIAPAYNIAPAVDVPFVAAVVASGCVRAAGGLFPGGRRRCRRRRCSTPASRPSTPAMPSRTLSGRRAA
jgi:hypothetical protein